MSSPAVLHAIRETILSHRSTRASAEGLVAALLEEIAYLPDADPAPERLGGERLYGAADGFPALTVGDVRARLRFTLEEIAAREKA